MTVRIFYAGLFFGEYPSGDVLFDIVDGAYIFDNMQWYHKNISIDPIDTNEVPQGVLALNLLIS